MLSFIYNLLKLLLLLILPFAILIRTSTFLHVQYNLSSSICILASALITAIILFVYFSFFYGRLTGKIGGFASIKRRALIAFLVVLGYSIHGVLFFKGKNVKSLEVKKELTQLHPILRLSLSTLIYLNKDLIITDASRVAEDYDKIGLRRKSSSLHFPQSSTGYAHAVDLRTIGKNEIRNKLVQGYFELLGFNTLRHIGNADHLHVSIFSKDAPHSK